MDAKMHTDIFVADANKALELKLVRKPEDIEDDELVFHPDMTHQVFGDRETIFGYQNLKIQLYYSASTLTTYLGISYSRKADKNECDGVEPDDVESLISKVIQPGYLTNQDDFRKALSKDYKFVPFGKLLHSFNTDAKDDKPSKTFEVYQCDISTPGFANFHERLQTFILWYIDAASFIDVDDDKWKYFTVYEKYRINGDTLYAVIGYATVYEYYAYPKNIRPRIGQILVLPPFQRQGVCVQLLSAIYQHYLCNPNVKDITVESPSEEFQRVRDFLDVKNCKALVADKPEVLQDGYSKKIEDLFSPLKISKKQMRRVYEILRLQYTDTKNEEDYKKYRLLVKKRLNIPYQKEKAVMKKLEKVLKEREFSAVLSLVNTKERMEVLDNEYRNLETEYRHIIDRLSSA